MRMRGRLVHVVLDAAHPVFDQSAMQVAPPAAHIGANKVREDAAPGPDEPHPLSARLLVANEIAALVTFSLSS